MKYYLLLPVALAFGFASDVAAAPTGCDDLAAKYPKYDLAAIFFDRISKSESSTLRQETALSALQSILIRQGIIIDMMIAKGCDLPNPPEFDMLGLINAHNG